MSSSFNDFMREMEDEARQAGPDVEVAFYESQQRHWMARLLYDRRRELGYTQAKLAAISGIDQGDISKIERADANPTLETLSSLATALQCTLALQPIPEETLALSASRRERDQKRVRTQPSRAAGSPVRVSSAAARASAATSGRASRSPRSAVTARGAPASKATRRDAW